jgi:hypothetical protein
MQFFVDLANGQLVGSGGFAAPPMGRTVEIGYEVAPDFGGTGSVLPLLGCWSNMLSPAARLTTSSPTLPGPNPSTVYSSRWTSSTSRIKRTLKSASSGNGDRPGRWSGRAKHSHLLGQPSRMPLLTKA